MKFAIYYNRKTFIGDGFEDACRADPVGVQVIAMEDKKSPRGYGLMHGADYYAWHHDSGWNPHDEPGIWQYRFFHSAPHKELYGSVLSNEDWRRVLKKASNRGLDPQ